MEHGFKEATAFGLGGGELCFQPVAHAHQFINLGDNAVLFCEGRKRNRKLPCVRETDIGLCSYHSR